MRSLVELPFTSNVIHHRGLLKTCLRPLGARVPSIYGKAGDDAAEGLDR
jgi:uncharacterized damage-inducible protein DinB